MSAHSICLIAAMRDNRAGWWNFNIAAAIAGIATCAIELASAKFGRPFWELKPHYFTAPQFIDLPVWRALYWISLLLLSRQAAQWVLQRKRNLSLFGYIQLGLASLLAALFDTLAPFYTTPVAEHFAATFVLALLVLTIITPWLLYKRNPHNQPPVSSFAMLGWLVLAASLAVARIFWTASLNPAAYLSSASNPATIGRWSEPTPQFGRASTYVSSGSHSFAIPLLSRM
jgi:hypothetical protein